MQSPSSRRAFLLSTAVSGLAATAGCLASGSPDTERTPTGTATPEDLDTWLDAANGYDGDPRRYGPTERPTIAVGEETDDGLAFSPAVIEVPPLTEVEWDWTGHGGQHNVTFDSADIDSGDVTPDADTVFEHTFEETGQYRYSCLPHQALGMKGAVIVE